MSYSLHVGDALTLLRAMTSESVHCVVTSPPYWRMRDYKVAGQIGMEETLQEYMERLLAVFTEVRRVLHPAGVMWLNLGDRYAASHRGSERWTDETLRHMRSRGALRNRSAISPGFADKQLIGLPWRVALALQDSGWYLRSDVIWHKPNAKPESVADRPTVAHEYVFLLSKSERYFFDWWAIREPQSEHERTRRLREQKKGLATVYELKRDREWFGQVVHGATSCFRGVDARQQLALSGYRRRRSVWSISAQGYRDGNHFATFPVQLAELCAAGFGSVLRNGNCRGISPAARSRLSRFRP